MRSRNFGNRFAASQSVWPWLRRRGDSRRRFSHPSRTDRSTDKIVPEFPHRSRKFATLHQYVVQSVNEHVDFFFADDQRRKDFQHVHAMTGYLRKNTMFAQHLSDDHLREEHLVDLVQKLPCHLELELARFVKLDAHHEAFATYLLYEGMFCLQSFDFLHEQCAHFS